MSDFFTFGPTGHGVAVDASGRVVAHDGRATGSYVFGYGDTGRPLLVDDMGRLLISIQSASGVALPAASLYSFGDKFYVTGSGATNVGFYIKGISNWEATTTVVASGEVNTASNLAGGVGLYGAKAGADLRFKSLLAGSGIQLTAATNTVRIDVKKAIDTPIVDTGLYYPTNNIEAALQTAGLKNKNFSDASGTFAAGIIVATGVRTDFDNASGVWQSDINAATQNTTDFTNSSGIFQAKVASITSAGGTSLVKVATGVLKGLTAGTGVILTGGTNDITVDVKDFINASGAFVKSVASAGGTTWVKAGTIPAVTLKGLTAGTGVRLTAGTNDITVNVPDFANASGVFVKSLASAGGMTQVKTGTAPALSIKGLTAVSGLGLVAGTNAISIGLHVPSGKGNPPDFATHTMGSMYYHEISGYMMRGQDKWQRITTPNNYWAKVWFDASPITGPVLTLTNANQYYKVTNYVAASGDQAIGVGGMIILSSGIQLNSNSAEGDYSINVSCTVNATNNKNFWMSLFDQETRIRSSTVGFRGTGQLFSNFATTIYPLNKNRVLNVRFMCTSTGGDVRIDTINLTMNREHKHNRG